MSIRVWQVAVVWAATGLLAGCEPASGPTSDELSTSAVVTELPLQRGFYVASDTACGEASNATLMLLRRDGIGGARDFCEFTAIEQTGTSSYRVTEACSDLFVEAGSGESQIVDYTLTGTTAFTTTSSAGWQRSARYCEQATLPADWRDNDISDLIR